MRLVFAGTPNFSRIILSGLLADARHEVAGVITQPDKAAGRRRSVLVPPAVKELAIEHGLPVLQPEYLTAPTVETWLAARRPDAVVVAAYGKIVPPRLLAIPPCGFINVHASLLPRWRGAAPIERAILAGDTETGVCIMQMEEGLDTGPIWGCERVAVGIDETAGELTERLAEVGAELLVRTLAGIEDGRLTGPTPQPEEGVSVAAKLTREELTIDWTLDAWDLHRRVMAANPTLGVTIETVVGPLKIWRTRVGAAGQEEVPGCALGGDVSGGEVLAVEPELVVGAGDRPLTLLEVQSPGRARMTGAEFARGRRIQVGQMLAAAAVSAGGSVDAQAGGPASGLAGAEEGE